MKAHDVYDYHLRYFRKQIWLLVKVSKLSNESVTQALGTAVEGIVQILQTAPRLLYMRVYSSFFDHKVFYGYMCQLIDIFVDHGEFDGYEAC